MSPLPNNFSAPPEPMIVLESVCELTANAILEGILFLIIPVITSTEGRCVATIKCIPLHEPFV